MAEESSKFARWARAIAWLIFGLICLPFLPLCISAIEHFVFGSDHFENLFRQAGLHDALDELYRPFVDRIPR